MTDSRIRLRAPVLAAILTFILPGLGHLFQGRVFKGLVYGVCITGMFLYGSALAEWKAIQAPPFEYRMKNRTLLALKYAAQFGMGTPAVAALLQTRRYLSDENRIPRTLAAPITAPFEGTFTTYPTDAGRLDTPVKGTLSLETVQGGFGETIGGKFTGSTGDGKQVELTLKESVDLDRPIAADWNRHVSGDAHQSDGTSGQLNGSIPRPLTNWFGAPLDDTEEQELEGRLGKWHELAVVLTWIAGLLNMLAIWDALEGPAYGYNDDPHGGPQPDSGPAPGKKPAAKPAATAV
ncbi:hypothetical protein Pan44_30180 [Caulifigura coniformis]|uniref:DUF6677 domain-containing protein n=1 Tax=Caulifigura coniformis TaxID=2527983 RepID=A0A517SFT6_9PLAN|nr:DUF6677 family protein [Caulifigura coniformis]QDT54977.1 hypothetical protein Pan44_30180 [Caulifigura coniformis]